jgi:hypothetical protein
MSDDVKPVQPTDPTELKPESWAAVLAMNTGGMQQALQTPFLFVIAVNPEDGQFQISTKSERPDVAAVLAEEFGKIWETKVIPMVQAQASPIVRPDGVPYTSPKSEVTPITKKTRRPPRTK